MQVRLSARPGMMAGAIAFAILLLLPVSAGAISRGLYQQQNLVSDIPGVALVTDPNLKNPWGLSHSPTGPWQVSDNATHLSTRYQRNGKMVPPVVTIPLPGRMPGGAPTGNVFNGTRDFVIAKGRASSPSESIFATEDGTISGWSPGVDPTHALIKVDRSGVGLGAVYKGIALASEGSSHFLYAANFRFGTVEKFDGKFNLIASFTDPQLSKDCHPPNGCFAPFGIQNIGGLLFVTFALQKPDKHDDLAGPGNGFVDVFDTRGKLLRRFASRGTLNSPWAMALAPSHFGRFSRDLLVGDFGDGRINAFDASTGKFLGQLQGPNGQPLTISGLWGLAFGNGQIAGRKNDLFFAAGLNDENDGLFGSIETA